MPVIALAFVACLASDPATCRQEHRLLAPPATPTTCLIAAQPLMARWTAAHPGWDVRSWRRGASAARDGPSSAGDVTPRSSCRPCNGPASGPSKPPGRRVRAASSPTPRASRRSHAELDAVETLDDGDPDELGRQIAALRRAHP